MTGEEGFHALALWTLLAVLAIYAVARWLA